MPIIAATQLTYSSMTGYDPQSNQQKHGKLSEGHMPAAPAGIAAHGCSCCIAYTREQEEESCVPSCWPSQTPASGCPRQQLRHVSSQPLLPAETYAPVTGQES